MRIGIFLSNINSESGGAYTFQKSIMEALNKTKSEHSFFVFYYGNNIRKEYTEFKYIRLKITIKKIIKYIIKKVLLKIGFSLFSFSGNFLKSSTLSKAISDNKIELIWFITPNFEPVEIPYIYTVWDLQHRLQPFFPEVSVTGWKWEDREDNYMKILPRASYIFTGTLAGKEEIMRFYNIDQNRIKIVPFPTPSFCNKENNIRFEIQKNENEEYLLYPAQFWPHKNHIVLLLVLKILREKHNQNYKLIFTGSDKGNLHFIKEKICELGLLDDVIIHGFISYNELAFLYEKAFALVFPSFFGPDNLPPLEAFSFGCPVIAANVPGAKEQLGDGALFVDPTNEEEIADAVKLLKENTNLREKLIFKGRQRAGKWTAVDYVQEVFKTVKEFEKYRRSWSNIDTYKHL